MSSIRSLEEFQDQINEIGKLLLAGVSAAMSVRPWNFAFVDMRWTKKSGTRISKLRVTLPDNTTTALLDTPFEHVPTNVGISLDDIWKCQGKVFPERWYGMKIIVKASGECEVKLDYDSTCAGDPAFFDD